MLLMQLRLREYPSSSCRVDPSGCGISVPEADGWRSQTRRLDLWGKVASFELDAPEATRVQLLGTPVPPPPAAEPASAPNPTPAAEAPAPDACVVSA